jgi:RNA polymerase sigma-70 factor (ECF subfamily)
MSEHQCDSNMTYYPENVTRLQRDLHAMLWTVLHRQSDVDDVLQETNLALWRKADEFDSSRDFRAWAFGIARIQVLAFRKRQMRNQRMMLNQELMELLIDEECADRHTATERHLALSECLQMLPQPRRDLVLLRYSENTSVNALAAEVGKSPKAISETLRRIRLRLRACIESHLARSSDA